MLQQACCKRAILGGHDPENVILMEIDPDASENPAGFPAHGKDAGHPHRLISPKSAKQGSRLFYEDAGKRIPIERIYNRAIVDELERKDIDAAFDFRDDLDVEWAGHPNWYFRISKFSIPYLKHPSVPQNLVSRPD